MSLESGLWTRAYHGLSTDRGTPATIPYTTDRMDAVSRWYNSLTPTQCRFLLAAVLLTGFVARMLYLAIDCPIGLSGDEAHYWDWSRQLDWSYYSKGPAVAYVIRLGCLLFGDNAFGVRFPALLLAIGISLSTYWLTRRVFRSEKIALGAVLLCHVVPMFVAGSMLMTIDPPYYFAWGMATCLAHLAIHSERKWAWPVAGLFVGLSALAKYAGLFWLVCLLIYLILDRPQRRRLLTPWPWITVGVALLCMIPPVIWNAQHDWVTFGHVSRSTTENQSGFNPLKIVSNFALMVGSQIGILSPVVAGLMVAGIIATKRTLTEQPAPAVPPLAAGEGERLRAGLLYLLCFSVPFFLLVSIVTLFKEIEPNWPAATYFTLVPLAAWFVGYAWPKTKGWLIAAIAIGVVVIPLVHYTTLFYPLSAKLHVEPRKWDPSFRLHGGDDIGREVSKLLKRNDLRDPFVLCEKYQGAGQMAFYVEGQPKTYYAGSYFKDPKRRDRLSQYDMWPDRSLEQDSLKGRDAVYVGHEADDLLEAFDRVEQQPLLPIVRRDVTIREQKLFLCYGFKGMTRPADGKTKR